jgi:hypothetical protein
VGNQAFHRQLLYLEESRVGKITGMLDHGVEG